MDFSLKILGTASALPISDRNPSAQVLTAHGRLFLIDCGEGTQQQMRRMHLSLVKIDAIFLSHMHGDHVFGIFGLLSTIGMYGRTEKLQVYAPVSFGPVLKYFLSYFGEGVNYEIEHIPLKMKEPQLILEDKYLRVTAFPLNHKIECFGFRFDEVQTERMALKAGRGPHSYAYCSDTAPFPQLAEWVRGVDVLYHDCTYLKEWADKAEKYFHSTTVQAAEDALRSGAGTLLIGHYSSRERDIEVYRSECREVFDATLAADDGMQVEIRRPSLFSYEK